MDFFRGSAHRPSSFPSDSFAPPVLHCAGLERSKGAERGARREDLVNRGETDRGEGPWLLSLPCWRPGCYCRPCAWLWLKWWVDRGGWNLLYLGFSWDKGPWKGLWMSWVDVIGCAVMDLVKVIKSPNTGLCVVTTWLYSIKRKTSLRYFLFLLSICCGDKLKWNIFCGLSSLSCMDTYLLSQGEESPLPFLAEKIFISGRMEDFF